MRLGVWVSYVAFVASLFASHLSFVWCLGMAVVFLLISFVFKFYSQPNGVMSSAVSLPNRTFTGQALSSVPSNSIMQILSPETDIYPS